MHQQVLKPTMLFVLLGMFAWGCAKQSDHKRKENMNSRDVVDDGKDVHEEYLHGEKVSIHTVNTIEEGKRMLTIIEAFGNDPCPQNLLTIQKIVTGQIRFSPKLKPLIPRMVQCFQHKDTNVHLIILTLLYRMGEARTSALPEITKCLKSSDQLVRAAAEELLEDLD
jgi:hypothetical protein